MYNVSTEILDRAMDSLSKPLAEQKAIFDEIDINPYDDESDGNHFGYGPVMSRSTLNDHVAEVQEDPDYFGYLSDERMTEIQSGATLTPDEIASIHSQFIEDEVENDNVEFAICGELSDGNNCIYALYLEQLMGQGGLAITQFLGFFQTEEASIQHLTSDSDIYLPWYEQK